MTRPYRIPPEIGHLRGRVAGLARAVRNGERPADDPALTDARRALAYTRLAEHVRKVVDTAPPPTPEQVTRIASILNAGSAA